MLSITIEVDIPSSWAFAVKEDLAMLIEDRYGRTTRVVDVKAKEKGGQK